MDGVPAAAVARMKRLNGHGANAVAVVVYGNRAYDDTLLELTETAEKAGFKCMAAVTAVAEHSIMRQFAEEDLTKKTKKNLRNLQKK